MSALIPSPNQSLSSPPKEASPTRLPTSSVLPRIDFQEVLNACKRRCWVPVLFAFLGGALFWFHAARQPVLYSAEGSIRVKQSSPEIYEGGIGSEDSRDLEQMKTVEQGMLSPTILLQLIEQFDLGSDPIYQAEGDSQQALLSTLYSRLNVELRKGSRLIDIRILDSDNARAAEMVEALVAIYEEWKESGRAELIAKASVELAAEEERLRKKMEESESLLRDFREANPVLNLKGASGGQATGTMEMLNRELTAATTERLRLETEVKGLGQSASDGRMLAAKGEKGQLILELERQLAASETTFSQLQTRYKYKHPKYIEAKNEIDRLKEQIAKVASEAEQSLQRDFAAAAERERELERLVAGARDEAITEETLREKFANLSRNAEIDRALHADVATRLQKIQIGSSLNSSILTWEAHPLVPEWPASPRKNLLLAAGIGLGGLLGLAIGLLLELLDRKVRERSAVERAIRVPELAALPVYDQATIKELSVDGAISKDRIRSLHLSRFTFTPRAENEQMEAVMFASAFEGDGKTTCVLKCARTFVKQGYRTLIVDADFRHEGLSQLYAQQMKHAHGLTAYLNGEAEAAEVLFETGLPGLWFLPSGKVDGNPADYLGGPGFKKLLEAVRPMFDRVVFDVSAVLSSDDVQAVARHVNASYYVARRGVGRYRDLQEAMDILHSSGARVVGFIWNEGGGKKGQKDEAPVIEPLRLVDGDGEANEAAEESRAAG
ncbi:MAG: hypothetical protein Q7Q71_02515 [Verrucomicrobiota bacterium JB023]|nr:hypothetical protein [Verrucomicrobiota bacterium JB023]